MTYLEQFPIGCLVSPRLERCYTNVRSKGRIRRYVKQECNFVRVCSEENRERPHKKSQKLVIGQSAVVLEHGGSERYPMLKLLIGIEGGHWVGWVLIEDVEQVTTFTHPTNQVPSEP